MDNREAESDADAGRLVGLACRSQNKHLATAQLRTTAHKAGEVGSSNFCLQDPDHDQRRKNDANLAQPQRPALTMILASEKLLKLLLDSRGIAAQGTTVSSRRWHQPDKSAENDYNQRNLLEAIKHLSSVLEQTHTREAEALNEVA
ncbi:hypothetical protein LTR56_027295 [Elasticomyces elasticus]|nr:hypothetical protein LTR56_027295 [Elasticomyces elasticus]